MKRILTLIFALLAFLILVPLTGLAHAQAQAGQMQGYAWGFLWPGSLVPIPSGGGGGGSPGGTSGQIQYNHSGSFGGFTVTGDATINTATGVNTVTKTKGTAFGPLATQAVPCTVSQGCTGTTTPSLIGGTNVAITGSWPDQTVAVSGGINLLPAQTGNYNAQGYNFTNIDELFADAVFASVNQTIQVTNPPAAYVNNGLVAKCDGTTDDTAAINGIIYQDGGGIGGFGNNVVQPIELPLRSVLTPSCFHTKPIEIPFGNLDFGGPPGSGNTNGNAAALSQNYYGDAAIVEGYNGDQPEMTTGPFTNTNSLVMTGISDGFAGLFLTPFLNSQALHMKGKGGSGFAVDFWIKPTGNSGAFSQPVFKGSVPVPGIGTSTIACGFTNTYTDFYCALNWSGGVATATSSTLPTTATWNYVRMNCVSGTCTLSIGGVSEATASYSGTLVEPAFDTYLLPSVDTAIWPMGGCNNCSGTEGDLAGLRIENASLGNTYPFSVPSALPTPDANSVLVVNFDKPADSIIHPWQQAYIGQSTPNTYISHWPANSGGGSTPPFNVHLHDINLCQTGTCEGVVLNWTPQSEIDHLFASDLNYIGIQSQEAFETHIHDNNLTVVPNNNGYIGVCYQWENAAESTWNHNFCATNGVGTVWDASSGSDTISKVQDGGGLVYGSMEETAHLDHQFWFDDCEDPNTAKAAEHWISGDYSSSTFVSGEDCTQNNSPNFVINGGAPPIITGDYVSGSATPENIDISSAPSGPVSVSGLQYNGYSTTPLLTNNYAYVINPDGSGKGGGTPVNGLQYYADDCGLPNNGTGDDAAPLRACMALMPAGATMNLDGTKQYYFNSHALGTAFTGDNCESNVLSNQTLNFNGATITQSAAEVSVSDNFIICAGAPVFNTPGSSGGSPTFIPINDTALNASSVTTVTASNAGTFNPGDDIYIDWGNNIHNQDVCVGWNQVSDVNASTGVINLKFPMLKSYVHTNGGNTGCDSPFYSTTNTAARIYDWTTHPGCTTGTYNCSPLAHDGLTR